MAGPFQREPGDPTGSRPLDIWLRALKRWVRGLELKSGPGYRKIPSPDGGFTLSIDPSRGGGANTPLSLYDKTQSYSPGARVVVPPTHELATDGLLDEETDTVLIAPAGFYECIRAAGPVPIDPEADPVEYRYNAPKWPLETADDIEATNTYWFLTALYPATVTKCINGTPTDSYENTQPVPEQPA